MLDYTLTVMSKWIKKMLVFLLDTGPKTLVYWNLKMPHVFVYSSLGKGGVEINGFTDSIWYFPSTFVLIFVIIHQNEKSLK